MLWSQSPAASRSSPAQVLLLTWRIGGHAVKESFSPLQHTLRQAPVVGHVFPELLGREGEEKHRLKGLVLVLEAAQVEQFAPNWSYLTPVAANSTREGGEKPAAIPTMQRCSDAFTLSVSGEAGTQLSVMSATLYSQRISSSSWQQNIYLTKHNKRGY